MLVAGLGNVFFGDDGFGVEVARCLAAAPLPAAARVVAFGVRGLDLSRALREPLGLLVAVDVVSRGGRPGTLYLLDGAETSATGGGSTDLLLALAAARAARRFAPRVCVVGCEPASLRAQRGLSSPVAGALEPAVALVTRLVCGELAGA